MEKKEIKKVFDERKAFLTERYNFAIEQYNFYSKRYERTKKETDLNRMNEFDKSQYELNARIKEIEILLLNLEIEK